jgi:hypothetical protein
MMSLNVEILSIELQRSYLSIQKREIFVHYTLFKILVMFFDHNF